MRHLDVAIYGMAAVLVIISVMLAQFGTRPKCSLSTDIPPVREVLR